MGRGWRGAFTNLLTREVPSAGVVAASGGNHGLAVAYAAMQLRVPAKIFVPRVASAAKIEGIRGYGADLSIVGERYADALEASEEWIERTGALPIHAFEQIETLLGQGTVGLEYEEQFPDLDTLLVAVGGGGLIGGIAAWYSGRIRIIGVEPEAAPTLTNALQAGHPVDSEAGGIAADSLGRGWRGAFEIDSSGVSSADQDADAFSRLRTVAVRQESCKCGRAARLGGDPENVPERLLGVLNG